MITFRMTSKNIILPCYRILMTLRYMLAHLFSKVGDTFAHLYDYGDKWHHEIEVWSNILLHTGLILRGSDRENFPPRGIVWTCPDTRWQGYVPRW